MSIRTPLATLALTLAVAGSASAQKVSTDWDHSAVWSKYNSYFIQIGKPFGTQLGQEVSVRPEKKRPSSKLTMLPVAFRWSFASRLPPVWM